MPVGAACRRMEAPSVKRLVLLLPLATVLALAWGELRAQVAAAAPAASTVSSSPAAKAARRPLAGQELRDSAEFPRDLEPEAPKPQIRVPLGRKPPVPATAASVARAGTDTANAGGGKVNDGVARCKAQAATEAREACLRALAPSGAQPGP